MDWHGVFFSYQVMDTGNQFSKNFKVQGVPKSVKKRAVFSYFHDCQNTYCGFLKTSVYLDIVSFVKNALLPVHRNG